MTRVLVLGGTAEAVTIANDLARAPAVEVIYSLAGRTRMPVLPGCNVRRGGFGGAAGLVSYLSDQGVDTVVDATHPYAARMAANARAASETAGIPLFKFLRPPWEEPRDAPWLHAATPVDAARLIGGRFSRVFLSSGLDDLDAFARLTDVWFLVRSVEASDAPAILPRHHHITARGPFDLARETALMRDWCINALVSKNSGGGATAAKLEAARALGVPVIMIARPPVPDGTVYDSVTRVTDALRYRFP